MKRFTNKLLLGALALCLAGGAAAAQFIQDAPAANTAQTATLRPMNCKEIDALRKKYPAHHIKPCTAAERRAEAKTQEKDYIACFTAWDADLHTLQTDFTQTTEYDGVLLSQSRGRIYYAKEGSRLRLDNVDGEEVNQSALTDKKNIFILDEKGKQISKLSWDEWSSGQPNQTLFDFGNYAALIAQHDAAVFERKDGVVILRLLPKDKKQNYTLYVAVGEEDCFPVYITVQSELIKTTAALSGKRLNAELKKDVFKGIK